MFRQKGKGDRFFYQALLDFNARRWAEAVEHTEKALEKGIRKYDMGRVYAVMGYSLSKLGRKQKAIEWHKKSVETSPELVEAWRDYGITLRTMGDYDGAEECYNRALAIDPNDEYTITSLGALYIFRDKPQRVIELIEPGIHDGVESGTTFGNLALAMAMVGRFDEADQYLSKAIAQYFPEWRDIRQRINDLREYHHDLHIQDTSWLPERCSQCGAALSNETVRWVNQTTVQCGYCGSVNRKKAA